MTGVEICLAGVDPVAVEAAADELKVRFGSRFSVTHLRRRTDGGLTVRAAVLVSIADPLDAAATDFLRRSATVGG